MAGKDDLEGKSSTADRAGVFRAFQESESIIKKYLRRFSSNRDDINDICQETVLRALEAERNKEVQEPRAFLFGIARNVARKELERKSKGLIDFIEDFIPEEYASNEPTIEDKLDSRQKMVVFTEAVSTLPAQCQRVFVLKKVHGYSHKEIATKLQISVSTVEKHVATGLKRTTDYMSRREGRDQSSSVGRVTIHGKYPVFTDGNRQER